MNALSAASLAGTIIQFVDFRAKILSNSVEVYRSGSGSTASNDELSSATTDLQNLLKNLKNSLDIKSIHRSPSDEDRAELRIGEECQAVALELQELLERRRSKERHAAKWRSLHHGLLAIVKKEEVDQLEDRLDRLRQQMRSTLLQQLDITIRELLRHTSHSAQWQEELTKHLHSMPRASNGNDPGGRFKDHGGNDAMLDEMLAELSYSGLRAREDQIQPAAVNTFKWIFSDSEHSAKPWSNFAEWLTRGSSVYWIAGKAGSGKSTLMRYIRENEKTITLLESVHGKDQVTSGSYYFWDAGTGLQKSYEGLLRSLLADVLRQNPRMLLDLLPEYCATLKIFGKDAKWTATLCLQALENLSDAVYSTQHYLFIVDDLDEYNGSHDSVIELLKGWAGSSNIKSALPVDHGRFSRTLLQLHRN